MDKLLEKMKEYLKMETELPFEEFSAYYNEVMGYLQQNYDGMGHEELFQAQYILQIVASNALARSQRKSNVSKKFRKMGEKADFWYKAINYRLQKEGLSQEEIRAGVEAVNTEEVTAAE